MQKMYTYYCRFGGGSELIMQNILAANIAALRKAAGLTQAELAEQIGISFQAVSKWETGQTLPDTAILPKIAEIFGVSMDKLFGYDTAKAKNPVRYWDESYAKDGYFWGVNPSHMCFRVMELKPPVKHLKLLDIGCGEGKDAVFFARCGYDVSAYDLSEVGVEKTKRLADSANVRVNVFRADFHDFRLENEYDIIYSSGVFGYMRQELRGEIIGNLKQFTAPHGLNAFQTFVEKPFIKAAPEANVSHKERAYFRSGELFTYYHDWYIHSCDEFIFDCNSSGVPHKHATNHIFAEKWTADEKM
jgi:tellurite methyltransferase